MTFSEYYERKIPEYYDNMYLDGYTAEQVFQAHLMRMREPIGEEKNISNIKITSEVKLK